MRAWRLGVWREGVWKVGSWLGLLRDPTAIVFSEDVSLEFLEVSPVLTEVEVRQVTNAHSVPMAKISYEIDPVDTTTNALPVTTSITVYNMRRW